MNKILRYSLIIIFSIISVLIFFIAFDSNRLKNSKFETKPLIVLSETREVFRNDTKEIYVRYNGIFYTVEYTYYEKINDGEVIQIGTGAEFRLFNRIFIWAWIE